MVLPLGCFLRVDVVSAAPVNPEWEERNNRDRDEGKNWDNVIHFISPWPERAPSLALGASGTRTRTDSPRRGGAAYGGRSVRIAVLLSAVKPQTRESDAGELETASDDDRRADHPDGENEQVAYHARSTLFPSPRRSNMCLPGNFGWGWKKVPAM